MEDGWETKTNDGGVEQHDSKRKPNWRQTGSKDKRWMNNMGLSGKEIGDNDKRWWNRMALSGRQMSNKRREKNSMASSGKQMGPKASDGGTVWV